MADSVFVESFKEAFIGAMNGQLNDEGRREKPCILYVKVTETPGILIGYFATCIAKPSDHVDDERFDLVTSMGKATVTDALTNLGIEEQLAEVERMIGQKRSVSLTVSLGMFPNYEQTVMTATTLAIDRTRDVA